MVNPLNSIGTDTSADDDPLAGIDDDLRNEFRSFTGNDLTRRGISRSNFETIDDAATALTNAQISRAIGRFTEARGAPPSRSEINTLADQLLPQYQQRLNTFTAQAAQRRRARNEADDDDDIGVLGTVGRLAGQAVTGAGAGIGRLGTLAGRALVAVESVNPFGPDEELIARQSSFLDGVDQELTDFREGVQQQLALPGAQRLQQELAQEAADNPDAGFGESFARTLGTVLSSGDAPAYISELLAYSAGSLVAGGVATGAIRGAARATAARAAPNVAVGTAARTSGITSIAAGQAAVGAGEVGEEARQQYLELDRQGVLINSPDFQNFYETIDDGQGPPIPYEEARDRYIRSRANVGRVLGGGLTAITTFVSPLSEVGLFGGARFLSSTAARTTANGTVVSRTAAARAVLPEARGGVVRRVAGAATREGLAEGVEEVGQQAIPNFVGGLDQDAAGLGQAAATGLLLGGGIGGALGGFQAPPTPETQGPPAPTQEQIDARPAGLPAPPETPPPAGPSPELLVGLGRDPIPGVESDGTPTNAREQEVAARFAFSPTENFVPSAALAADAAAPDADREAIAERLEEERAAARSVTAGSFSVNDAAGAAGLDPQDAARLRTLVETGDAQQFFGDSEGPERTRLTNLALRYANSTPGDGDPITNVALAVRAPNDPSVLGPVGDRETLRNDALFGARVAQVLKRVATNDAGFPAGPQAVFGRAGRTGAVADLAIHGDALSPNEAFETYFSDPDGRDFAIAINQAQIAYREQGETEWRLLDDADSSIRREALNKGYTAAQGDPNRPETIDADLRTVLDDAAENTANAAAARVAAAGQTQIEAAGEGFVIAASDAATDLRAQEATAQEAAAQYLRSPQALEAWQQSVEGAARTVVLPPTNLPAGTAADYVGAVLDTAVAELDRLASPFDETRPGVRITRVRNSLNRAPELRATGVVASGSAQINAFVRELAGTGTPVERARLADRVIEALRDPATTAEVDGVSLTPGADGFFATAGPAGTLRSETPVSDLLAVAYATQQRAIREQRLARILDRDLVIEDGDLLGAPIDQAAIGAAFTPTSDPLLSIAPAPRATPIEAERGAAAVIEALQVTPGVDPLSTLATPADAAIEAAQQGAVLAEEAAQGVPTEETLDDLVSRVAAIPDAHLNSGSLLGLQTAANRLRRAHQFARSAPITARARFTDTASRLRYTATALQAQYGSEVALREPTPDEVSRIEGPGIARARLDAAMNASISSDPSPEGQVRAAKLAAPLLSNADIVIALQAPVTAEQVASVAASEQVARETVEQILSGVATDTTTDTTTDATTQAAAESGDVVVDPATAPTDNTRFSLGAAVANPIAEAPFNQRIQEVRDRLRGQRISVRSFATFDAYLQDLARTYEGTNSADAVRRYVAQTPPFAGQFTQREQGGDLVLIREAIQDEAALERVLSHEIVGHYRMADLLTASTYRDVRAAIQGATARIDPELHRMRQRVERQILTSLRRDNNFDDAEARRILQTPSMVERVADEVLGSLAERLVTGDAIAPEVNRVVDLIQRGLDATGIPTRNTGTRWIGTLLQISRDTTLGELNPMQFEAQNAQARTVLRNREGRETFSVVDETWLQERYRRNLNSVAYLGRLERATRLVNDDVSRAWRDVRLAEDRANRTAAAVADAMHPALKRVTDITQQIFDDSGMGRAEFDRDYGAWLNARDYLDRVPAIVLNQTQSSSAGYNQRRTELRERIIEEAANAPDGVSPSEATYIADLRQAAIDNNAQDVLQALEPGAQSWRNITGFTFQAINEIVTGPVGRRFDALARDTDVGGQRLDDALDDLRTQFLDAQRTSGTYGVRGVALARALGIRHYIPQEARAEDAGASQAALATLRNSSPELAALDDSDLGAFEILTSRAPTVFDNDLDPFATRPRNDFNSSVRGSPVPPSVHPLVLLQLKARSVANAVATQEIHRAVRDAAVLTQDAEANGDGSTQFGRAATIVSDFDLTTEEGTNAFRELISQGNTLVAYDETGDVTVLQVDDSQLLSALTDRHITQSRIERHALRRTAGQATRFLGRLHTSLDPVFVVFKQFLRDFPEAALVAGGGEQSFSPRAAGNVAAEAIGNVGRLGGFFFGSVETQQRLLGEWRSQPAGSWQRNFAEFVDAGGRQAFSQGIDDVVSGLAGGAVARQEIGGARTPFEFIGDNVSLGTAVGATAGAAAGVLAGPAGIAAGAAAGGAIGSRLSNRVTGRDSVGRNATRRLEGFTNLFDNATRFALFNETRRQRGNRPGARRSQVTADAIEVSNSLLPFNRRSELSRQGSSFFAFFNVAVASTDATLTRRIWRNGEIPTRTVRIGAQVRNVLDIEQVREQLNWPLATFVMTKGFLATALALQFIGADEEDGPEEGVDRARISTYTNGTVLPGTFGLGRDGEGLAAVIPEQLGVTGQLHAIGASFALAMFSDYDKAEIAANMAVSTTRNLTPLSFDTSADTGNLMADLMRVVTPTFANTLNELVFDTNRFNNPVSRLRDGQTSTGTPQSTRFSPGVLAMSRALEDAFSQDVTDANGEVIGQEPGLVFDPGVIAWMANQAGAFGDVARGSADAWARYSIGETVELSDVIGGAARGTGLFPATPQYATRSGYYRYAGQIEDARNTFRALAKQDIEDGTAGETPNFSPRARSSMGPRALAYLDTLPEGFWQAKSAVDRARPRIGQIKQEVDNISRSPDPDPQAIAGLITEETQLYRDGLDLLRDAFDDGYDAQLVF